MSDLPALPDDSGLAVHVRGEGPPLLWGHGLNQSMAGEDRIGPFRWRDIDTRELGRTVVRWDARGHGSSPPALREEDATWRSLADDALTIADETGFETFAIGGASMGAATALWATVLAPERVTHLVLAIPPTAWESRGRTSTLYGGAGRLLGLVPSAGPLEAVANRGRVLRGAASAQFPERSRVSAIAVPTTILAWRGDPVHPVATAEELHELIPESTLLVTRRPFDVTGWVEALTAGLAR